MPARYLQLAVFSLLCWALLSGCAPPAVHTDSSQPGQAAKTLVAGMQLEQVPRDADDARTFIVEMQAGDYLQLHVEQLGVDVLLRLSSPSGLPLLEVDSPTGRQGFERLYFVTSESGSYLLRVEPFAAPEMGGHFVLRVEAQGLASPRQRLQAAAAAAEWAARVESEPAEVRAHLRQAWRLWQQAAAPAAVANVEMQLAELDQLVGHIDAANTGFRRAAAGFEVAGEPLQQATALLSLGSMYYRLDRLPEAIAVYRLALAPAAASTGRHLEADLLFNLGTSHLLRGELQQALDYHEREAAVRGEAETMAERAERLHNLGILNWQLGRWQRAVDLLSEAVGLFAQLGDQRRWANSLVQLGEAQRNRGEPEAAEESYLQALAIQRQLDSSRELSTTLVALGLLHKENGRLESARELYLEVLERSAELSRADRATTLHNLAAIDRAQGRPEAALRRSVKSLALHRRSGSVHLQAHALVGLAAAERQLALLTEARRHLEQALELFESTRYAVLTASRRSSYLATVQPHYGNYIDLLVELGEPAAALAAVERSRARSLLDALSLAALAVDGEEDAELLAAEERARGQVEELAARRQALSLRAVAPPDLLPRVEADLRLALDRLEVASDRRRAGNPRYRELTRPRPLDVGSIRGLLDADTQLLELHLGERRSFLWLVDDQSLELFELPPAAVLEQAARAAYLALGRSHHREGHRQAEQALCDLSRQLLGVVGESLRAHRLVMVADGALRYLPLAVLPDPRQLAAACDGVVPLVENFEVVSLPSVSVLAEIRRGHRGQDLGLPSSPTLAVLADPVVAADDPRLRGLLQDTDLPSASAGLRRLPFSGQEAATILALAEADSGWSALAFAAAKPALADPRLMAADIVHFAVHGVLDSEHPELSGLMLSRFDRGGQARDGFLSVHQVYNLRLDAKLVVLSACRTALGREIRGEGLVGLTRGFMFAGAERVLVSLWNVDDAATAELMERFYRALLHDHLRPSAALRRAQLELRRQPGRQAPFFWAGFELQGDWR